MLKRAVIYARYSSDLQRETSIQDQVRQCRAYAEGLGFAVVEVYEDHAQSGRSAMRPGFQRLLNDVPKQRFDMVVALTIDRIGRRLADVADLADQLGHYGIAFHSPTLGPITLMHVAFLGSMAQEQARAIGVRTKSAQQMRAIEGYVPAGVAYGYEVLPPTKIGKNEFAGERQIIDEQASIVRRIFTEYAEGRSPEDIARRLNDESIPGPRGDKWLNTTIRGQAKRGTGILNNQFYIGLLSWNRCSYVKNPITGKREARPNPESEWQTTELPHLRIIDDDLWLRVKARQEDIRTKFEETEGGRNMLNASHRPKTLFAGLLKCSHCGGSYTKSGKDRIGCANRGRGSGDCTNAKTIKLSVVEGRILDALRHNLMAPEIVEAYVAEVGRLAEEFRKTGAHDRSRLERRLADLETGIGRLLDMIERGHSGPSIEDRLAANEREKDRLLGELATIPEIEHDVLAHLPNLGLAYARKIQALADSLNDEETRSGATEALRVLVEKIVMIPDADAPDGMRMEVHGAMAEILALCTGDSPKSKHPGLFGPGCQTSVVAGAGFEPATFRL